jgi:hypothetical protein
VAFGFAGHMPGTRMFEVSRHSLIALVILRQLKAQLSSGIIAWIRVDIIRSADRLTREGEEQVLYHH